MFRVFERQLAKDPEAGFCLELVCDAPGLAQNRSPVKFKSVAWLKPRPLINVEDALDDDDDAGADDDEGGRVRTRRGPTARGARGGAASTHVTTGLSNLD